MAPKGAPTGIHASEKSALAPVAQALKAGTISKLPLDKRVAHVRRG